jgi:adenylate cyclase
LPTAPVSSYLRFRVAEGASQVAHEIERKYLVVSDEWRRKVTASHGLVDVIAPFGEGKVRIRVSDTRAWIAFKGPREDATRAEFEYEIPRVDAEEMLRVFHSCQRILKTRHCVPDGIHVWSVDVHGSPNEGLVTAEVELDDEQQSVPLPAWVGPEITGKTLTGNAPIFFQPA